jgi:predicted GNAT family acetyltransferase
MMVTMTDDEALDETLEETFPASDPPGKTGETGIRLEVDRPRESEPVVRDHPETSRFEAVIDGHVAFLQYERRPKAFVILHTEVPESLRGKGIGGQLAKTALEVARSEGLPIVVRCPFVRAYLQKHRG